MKKIFFFFALLIPLVGWSQVQNITFNYTVSGDTVLYIKGSAYEIDSALAQRYIDAGFASLSNLSTGMNTGDSTWVQGQISDSLATSNAPSYGFMTFSDSSITITATGPGTYDPITNAANDLFIVKKDTGDIVMAGDSITINCDCGVVFDVSVSYSAGNNSDYELALSANGTELPDIGVVRGMSGTDAGVAAFHVWYMATSGDVIKPVFEEQAGTTDPTFYAMNIWVGKP